MTDVQDRAPKPTSRLRPVYAEWASKSHWSLSEAAYLMLNFDPKDVSAWLESLDEGALKTAEVARILDLFGTAKKVVGQAQDNRELPIQIEPKSFVDWLDRIHPQGAHPALSAAVRAFAVCKTRDDELTYLREALRQSESELRKIRDDAPLPSKKSRASVCIMIYAMAASKFGFDPHKRNGAASAIVDAANKEDLLIDEETVKGWLDESKKVWADRSIKESK